MSQSDAVQRLQCTFAAEGPLRYVSHLDLMRVWERVCKRAGLPLASSKGFSPRPKIALAAPLAVGVTSECELLDVLLTERVDLAETARRLGEQLTAGLSLLDVSESPLKQPSLQSMVRAASYVVEIAHDRSADDWQSAIDDLLAREDIPWSHQRGKDTKSYDLRPLILGVELISADGASAILRMRLRNDERGAGRPEQVLLALDARAEASRIHRVGLELTRESLRPAVSA